MTKRNRRTGKFKKTIINANNKREFLEQYYEQHKARIDRAIAVYKKRHPFKQANKKIFVDKLLYGTREWHGAQTANEVINRTLYYMRNGSESLEYFDAVHDAKKTAPKELKDLRRFNNKKPGQFVYWERELSTSKDGTERTLEGYYNLPDTDYVIGKVLTHYSKGSPTEEWEYVRKDEIGI